MTHAHAAAAATTPPFDPAATPQSVVLARGSTQVRLTWPGGKDAALTASRLRNACRCAWCTRARYDGTFVDAFEDVAIERLVPIGGYAVNIAFSDGHARGIYPWTYLRTLAEAGGVSDQRQSRPPAGAQQGTYEDI